MHDALARALAAGATVVTPNRRLARHLIDDHDRSQRAAGKLAWPAARALPWQAWLGAMQDEAATAGALPPLARLSVHGSALLWRAGVDADVPPVIDVAALAASAAEAWEHVHAYGSGGESWRGWAGGDAEPAAFARWAERYRAALVAHRASDLAVAADRIAHVAPSMSSWRARRIVLAGFVELTPQQKRLAEALAQAGLVVEEIATLGDARASPRRAAFASADAELAGALAWARLQVEQRPDARVGIVVPDLAQRLAAVRLRAIDLLGLPDDGEASVQAWNLSLGSPIDAVPLVAAALDLVALAWTSLPPGRAAALLRSAHLPGAGGTGRHARAVVEREWLEEGVDTVRSGDAIAALERHGDGLARRLAALRAVASRRRRATRHDWIDAWREALAAAGWPGDAALRSDDHQAMGALDEHFAAFAALDAVAGGRVRGELSADEAIAAFAEICAGAPFQPESPPAPIQVLGLYEAIGLPFDALWVTGMNDQTLPRAPRPHPLLPVRWQREHGVPRSDAARELAYAREVASWLLRAAPDVVVSHATTVDDHPSAPAAVFPAGRTFAPPRTDTPATAMFASRPSRERIVETSAPALASGERRRAGSGLVGAQSDCPFQALAARRWRADPWPAPIVGLTPMERGNLVHAALAAFWREVHDHASLAALLAEPARYADVRERAARGAMATIDAPRWRRVPPAVRALEEERLSRLLAEWVEGIELSRPPFDVLAVEHDESLALGPLVLALRLDRVDRLADGGVAIVDYKTGSVPSIARWTRERPEATQLALYTLAWRAAHPDAPVRAAVLARVKRGESKPVGLYADDDARLCRPTGAEHVPPVVDWPALESRWSTLMSGLVDAFVRGEAQVAPREPSVCRTCARHALCRIGDAAPDDEDDA